MSEVLPTLRENQPGLDLKERVPAMHPSAIARIPRHRLAQLPTPLMKVDFGWSGCPLYVKRDDLTGSALSGNKVRKLEYLVADARNAGTDTLITCGDVQSNCARALAVAATITGFRSVLVLTGVEPRELNGNLLLDHLVGSNVHLFPSMDAEQRDLAMEQIANWHRRRGQRPYIVPFGGSSEVGVLGYVRAAYEIRRQLAGRQDQAHQIVMPMASGGTYAGLFIGFQLAGLQLRPVGAFVEGVAEHWVPDLVALIRSTARRFRLDVQVSEEDIQLIDARGHGYAQPTTDELKFININTFVLT